MTPHTHIPQMARERMRKLNVKKCCLASNTSEAWNLLELHDGSSHELFSAFVRVCISYERKHV